MLHEERPAVRGVVIPPISGASEEKRDVAERRADTRAVGRRRRSRAVMIALVAGVLFELRARVDAEEG